MKSLLVRFLPLIAAFLLALAAAAQTNSPKHPTWWAKYQYLAAHGFDKGGSSTRSTITGKNVDASNECGPQSETFITLNSSQTSTLAAGSNEIFRLPMRGYFSTNGGGSWGGVDLSLPPPLAGTNDTRFGSDPSLAFDTSGNLYYSYIVVFFGNGFGVNGSEMAVAHSTNGGRTYPATTFFNFQTGRSIISTNRETTKDWFPMGEFLILCGPIAACNYSLRQVAGPIWIWKRSSRPQ